MTDREKKEIIKLLKDAEVEFNARRFWSASAKYQKAISLLEKEGS